MNKSQPRERNPASIETLTPCDRAPLQNPRNQPKRSRRKSRDDGSTYGPWPRHHRKPRRFGAARRDSGPYHLRVADQSAPAFKHLTSMRGISRACGRHAANPRQRCHNDEWHETEPGIWAAIAWRSRRRGTGGCHAKAENIPQKKRSLVMFGAKWRWDSNAASTGREQRDEFRGSAAGRHRRSRGALALMQSSVVLTRSEIRLLREACHRAHSLA